MGWMVQGSNPGEVARYSTPIQTSSSAHSASCTIGNGSLSLGVKWPGCGNNHKPSYSAKVKERVELYLHSPSGLSGHVVGWTLPYLYPFVCVPSCLFHCWTMTKVSCIVLMYSTCPKQLSCLLNPHNTVYNDWHLTKLVWPLLHIRSYGTHLVFIALEMWQDRHTFCCK